MSLNNVTFVKGQGGLGRPLPGQDYISALVFYTANGNLPSGFSTSARIKQMFAASDAIAAGIKNDYTDETKATGVYTISGIGANGDQITLKFTEPEGVVVTLGTFIKTASESSVTLLAAALVAAINAGTNTHGYSAANTAGAITVTVRAGLGIFPNSGTPLTAVIVGTIAGSITTAVAGGVASLQAVWYYHISEFFRMQPKGNLFVGFFAIPGSYTYSEIATMQSFAKGTIRQVGVYKESATAYTAADTTAIQAIAATLDTIKQPVSVILGANIAAVSDISTLATLATLTNNKASVVIAQDGAGLGNALWYATGKSITALGAILGAVAFASVSDDIAWVGKFNFSNGIELDTLAFANGVKISDSSITTNLLDALDNKRYIFLRTFPNVAGSYANDSHTAIAVSSDYAYIENNRVIDKAIRGVDASMTPLLASPLLLNADGTLTDPTIAYFENQADTNVLQMVKDGELSARKITIDPNQNVASTSRIIVTIQLLPVGVARMIQINIGFTTKIQ